MSFETLNSHGNDWVVYSGRTDIGSGKPCHNFSISKNLSQIVNFSYFSYFFLVNFSYFSFMSQSHSPALFRIYFSEQWLSLYLGNFDVVVSVSIDFPLNLKWDVSIPQLMVILMLIGTVFKRSFEKCSMGGT